MTEQNNLKQKPEQILYIVSTFLDRNNTEINYLWNEILVTLSWIIRIIASKASQLESSQALTARRFQQSA